MKSKIITLLIALIFVSCDRSAKQNDGNNDTLQLEQKDSIVENNEFQQYLSYFKKMDLPITIYHCNYDLYDSLNLHKFSSQEYNKYIGDYSNYYEEDVCAAFAQIPTNGDFLATILFGYLDCYLPILTTYTYDGKEIDSKNLSIGYSQDINEQFPSSDKVENYDSTDSLSLEIYKDFTIYVSNCHTFWLDGEIEEIIVYKEGKILKDGKIEISKPKVKKKKLISQ